MFKINKKTEYALMALKFMHEKCATQKSTAREICNELSIPFDSTAKVLQVLKQAGIVKSVQGINGGYQINFDLNQLSFRQLTELIEGKDMMMDCSSGNCELYSNCNITGPVKKLNDYLAHFFQQLTIKQLIEKNNLIQLTTQQDQRAANEL